MERKKKQKLDNKEIFERIWYYLKDNTELCKKHAYRLFLFYFNKAKRESGELNVE